MNTILYLGLWVLLTVGLANGIRCAQCLFQLPGKACSVKKQPCNLYVGQSCFKQIVYYGWTPLYIKKGCMPGCKTVKGKKVALTINERYTCCSHLNLCNF
ncbi:hypothetical protein JRQ81_010869 [Phrynocephalus forsythii]|uniref:UPAR/Ly6 domain-containing protein n=1 Tax=Phrynocephalus forsythii TaxID=171643 RepID=A0A9Q0X7L6_9SAUR|nr:hypothetical protein JRQ81_010869 [Phrynocephalus forsythii]